MGFRRCMLKHHETYPPMEHRGRLLIFEIDRSYYQLSNAMCFREDDPQMHISARVRGIFQRMRNSVKKGVPKFMDPASAKV